MELEVPDNVKTLLDEIVASFKDTLGTNLVGIYLHGSLAMKCFNSISSDIDFLVVTENKVTIEKRKEIAEIMLELNDKAPPKGLEMSILTQDALKEMQHPMPFEFHFSNDWVEKFRNGEIDLTQERKDGDLAGHLTIIKSRGVTLYGPQIERLFPDVPEKYYYDSIEADAKDILFDMPSNPLYNVLNLCRVWAYKDSKLITSKQEGGEWALKHGNSSQKHTINKALKEYKGQQPAVWDRQELDEFGRELSDILNIY
ncbi:DUF4111 domain-containing protein [Candidatus Nomurabacteria bacterium]|nr:DUF4111 domain-containing protein [Candidatus Nomurabacteria bacterium]